MESCPFKYLFGRPRTGVHSMRIPVLDWAVADTIMTIILAWFLAKWLRRPFLLVLLLTFLVGEISHVKFCVDTAFTRRMIGTRAPNDTAVGAQL